MNNVKQVLAVAPGGFVTGMVVAYVVAPSNPLALLAVGSAVAAGASFGLFSDAFFAGNTRSRTERQRTGKSLQESRDFLQTVIDGIPDVTMVINRDHRIVLANQATREAVRGEDPVAGCLTCHHVSHHSNVPCKGSPDPCPLEQVIETKKPVTVTHTHYDPDDNGILVEVHATPVFDEAGDVVQVIEACRDLSTRQHAPATLLAR